MVLYRIGGKKLSLNKLEKVFWPEEGYKKADLIQYYARLAPLLVPHLYDHPLVLHRFPDGIEGKSFYQKDCPEYAPEWLKKVPIYSHKLQKTTNYCLANDMESLIWLVAQGCIEMHPWLSYYWAPEFPRFLIFDLDPSPPSTFRETVTVAFLLKKILDNLEIECFPKTSGATGLHIFVPLILNYNFSQIRRAASYIAKLAVRLCPEKATLERSVDKRDGKVYIDYLQNARGKTLASVYSVRPYKGATVSTPLTWEELKVTLAPDEFNIRTVPERVKRRGDLFQRVLKDGQRIESILKMAGKRKVL